MTDDKLPGRPVDLPECDHYRSFVELFVLIIVCVKYASKEKALVGSLLELFLISFVFWSDVPNFMTETTEPLERRLWRRKGVVATAIRAIDLIHDYLLWNLSLYAL